MILLDTHALLWWALDPARLSRRAANTCRKMERDGGYASSISVWELGIKIQRGKLEIGLDLDEFVLRLRRSGVVELLAVDTSVWLRSLSLDWEHRDPADRVIAATAILEGLPILTKDRLLHRFAGIRTIW